jgi:hypothetical protein
MEQEDFDKLVIEVRKLEKQQEKIRKALDVKIPLLKRKCSHETTSTRNRYVPGSYLDKSESHKITYCTICDTDLKDEVSYGFYG